MAVYSVFMMLGSMIIATLFGITIWSESANVLKIIGIVLLTISIVIPVVGKGEKMNFTFTILCIISGTINGLYTVVSIWHSKLIGTDSVTNVNSFMNWQYLFMAIICLVTYIVMKFVIKADKGMPSTNGNSLVIESKKPFYKKFIVILILSAGMYALSSGFGYFTQLIVLETLPATVVTPCISGLAIVFSAVAGYIFFKEKTGIKDLISIAITIVGVALIIIDALVVI
jgi:multidrug transporter EmrE-like cation transporter